VIQEGQISYPLPVNTDATAICQAPSAAVWRKFLAMYQRYGRARLTLHSRIVNAGSEEDAVKFVGQYVLHR
jgi:thioesterase domain-containing protein